MTSTVRVNNKKTNIITILSSGRTQLHPGRSGTKLRASNSKARTKMSSGTLSNIDTDKTRQLQSLVTVRELTSIETRQKVGLAIGWIDIQGFARPVI